MTSNYHQVRKMRKSVAYERLYEKRQPTVHFEDRLRLHDFAADYVGKNQPAKYLEFGVFRGETFFRWSGNLSNPVTSLVGFDSFVGLPEDWDVGFRVLERGTFSTSGVMPKTNDPRVSFVKGWFQDTLPSYLQSLEKDINAKVIVHFDAALYSSTLFLLSSLWHYIPEYYFLMDDFMQDDIIALHDFTTGFPVKIEWLADRIGPSGLPVQAFGRLKRTDFVQEQPEASERCSIVPQGEIAVIKREEDADALALVTQFESIGADCEFGLVQRHYGAEPLGLLRWSSIAPTPLLALLRTRFEGFCDPANLLLFRAHWGEYFIRNTKFDTDTHTWTKTTQTDEAAFFSKHIARTNWLTSKMLENLACADRIYIYKLRPAAFSQITVDIASALRSYGDNHLLCVDVADAEHIAGTVEVIAPGLARGFISRHGQDSDQPGWHILYDEWLSMCRAMLQHVRLP